MFPRGSGRVVVAQAAGARSVVADGVAAKGWHVDLVEAYRTIPVEPTPEALAAAKESDAILFTSASTVTSFLTAAGADAVPPVVVCIGPITAAAAADAGIAVTAVPEEHTIPAMVAALARCPPAVGFEGDLPRSAASAGCAARPRCAGSSPRPGCQVDDLVAPLFVREGIDEPQPIASLPGVVQHTRESLRKEVARARRPRRARA